MNPRAPRRYLFYVEQNYCYGILRPVQQVLQARHDEVAWLPVGRDFDRSGFRANERVIQSVREAIDWQPCAVMAPEFLPRSSPASRSW
jgi:hypothetical protein